MALAGGAIMWLPKMQEAGACPMAYVRISLMEPEPGREPDLRSVLDRLVDFYSRQPGNVSGYRLESKDGTHRFGRIGVWATQEDADRAAQTEHDLALRSELTRLVRADSHLEYGFEGTANTTPTAG